MTSPFQGDIVGFARSNKDIDFGWARPQDEEQFRQLLANSVRQLDAALHNVFAWNPRQSLDLRYAFFGGLIDSGAAWVTVPAGSVTLLDNATNYIQRVEASGVVQVNQVGFGYPDQIPMAIVKTRNGIVADYEDKRPELGGASAGGAAGCSDFPCLVGSILDGQVPESAVKQYEGALAISFTQMTDLIADAQVPQSAVKQHEAALAISFTQMTDQILDSQVPASAVIQHCQKIDECLGAFIPGWNGTLTNLVEFVLAVATDDLPPHELCAQAATLV